MNAEHVGILLACERVGVKPPTKKNGRPIKQDGTPEQMHRRQQQRESYHRRKRGERIRVMPDNRYRVLRVEDAGPKEVIVQKSPNGGGWEYVCSIRLGNKRTFEDVQPEAERIIQGLKMVDSITPMRTR